MPYTLFRDRFPEIAKKETRSIMVLEDAELPKDHYLLMELYCDEPECDCRRVMFYIFSEEVKKIKDQQGGSLIARTHRRYLDKFSLFNTWRPTNSTPTRSVLTIRLSTFLQQKENSNQPSCSKSPLIKSIPMAFQVYLMKK